MSIDISQFHAVFFEESLEGLETMEKGLLSLSPESIPDKELINAIFRAAHSIKGGSGTFGFSEISEFTHVLETYLDLIREGRCVLQEESIELLLKSCDCLRDMVIALQRGQDINMSTAHPLMNAFNAMLAESDTGAGETCQNAGHPSDSDANDKLLWESFGGLMEKNGPDDACGLWRITFKPDYGVLLTGNEPLRIFRELESLGKLEIEAHTDQVPDLAQLVSDECYMSWTLTLKSQCDRADIEAVFEWVMDDCELDITLLTGKPMPTAANPAVTLEAELADAADGAGTSAALPVVNANAQAAADVKSPADSESQARPVAGPGSESIRVGIDKIDNLINLVGELVITQSMLTELGSDFDMSKLDRLSTGLEQLLQNTKELQENVMRIRMLPISFAFNRFPRMIRDLCAKTGKKIDLVLIGEQTELDKTVMEQIGDPLVHLVRNAADHGVEDVAERLAAGKPETGRVVLNAYHQGGNIVIEISDDGRGLNAEKILSKAVAKGIIEQGATLTQEQIYELIFEPGFSTAEKVSDISGRGVGMDVVRRNISALGGRIEVMSIEGKETRFRIYLPLTLAILDGQLVRVGDQIYIIPLISIVESLQIKPGEVNFVAGNQALYRLRDDNVPIVPIYREFGIAADCTEYDGALLVVVESDCGKVGLLVDDLLAQQQVVIKSLENNYRRVEGVSGATILGDGSVALILDVSGLVDLASRRKSQSKSVCVA